MESRSIRYMFAIGLILIVAWLAQSINLPHAIRAQASSGTEFRFTIDATAHARYGLSYPVTFVFAIPQGSHNLTAQYRHQQSDAWQVLPNRQAGDSFNGVLAARFDATQWRAYVSAAFTTTSDTLYLRVVDESATPIVLNYQGMARLYDNRAAAVTVSLDDWADFMIDPIDYATSLLADLGLYHTVSVITGGVTEWNRLQQRINTGYTEAAAHTRVHPCDAQGYSDYGGYDAQINGSRLDLLSNLSVPQVSVFAQPCGYEDSGVRQAVVNAQFLVDRDYETNPGVGQIDFAPWSADGAYAPLFPTYVVYVVPGRWENGGSPADLAEANAAFDTTYAASGIYHFTDHPSFALWQPNSYLHQHMQYIAGRSDVWYVSLGALYQYHFVQERNVVTVDVLDPVTPTPTSTATNTPTPGPSPTQGPTPTATPTPMYVTVNDPDLQALWRFEEVAGDRFDSSGHGNALTDHNTVGSGTLDPPQGTRYASFVGAEAEFLSIDDDAQLGLALTGDYSLAVWLRPNTDGYTSFGIADKRGSTASGYQIYFSGGLLVVLHRNDWSDDYDISEVNLGDEVPDGDMAWTHLAITYDADTHTVNYFINGQLTDSANDLDPPGDDHAPFIIGPEPNNTYYTGYMDELAVFDRALSPADVRAIFQRGIRDVGPNVVGVTRLHVSSIGGDMAAVLAVALGSLLLVLTIRLRHTHHPGGSDSKQ
jgi:hypothetical protein